MVQKNKKEKIIMHAKVRKIIGKQTRALRKEGIIPANIYGKNFTSQTIALNQKEFVDTFKTAGETNIVYVILDDKEIPTLISEIQIHPINQSILHVDLRKINLKQKIEVQVPITIIGTSEAVENKNGILLTQMTEITVTALPSDIPDNISVDISNMNELGDVIRISDLPKSDLFYINEDSEQTIVSVTEHKEEELEPETVSEKPEIIGEGETEATTEGESSESVSDQAHQNSKSTDKDKNK